MPTCTPLLAWSLTIWHGFLILMWMGGLGLMAWTIFKNNKKWTVLSHLIALIGVCAIAFSIVNILAIWQPGVAGIFTIPPKILMAALSVIIAISVVVLLPGWKSRVVLPNQRTENINKVDRLNNNIQRENNRLTEQVQKLYCELGIRTQSILESMSSIAANTSATDKQAIARITCHLYQLTHAQERLISSEWRGISLHDCIEEQLKMFNIDEAAKIEGPHIMLNAHQTQYLYMAIFELCLTSIWQNQKTQQKSQFAIKWTATPGISSLSLHLTWHEERLDTEGKQDYNVILQDIVPKAFSGEGKLVHTPTYINWTLTGILDEDALYDNDADDYPRVLRCHGTAAGV